MSGLAIKRNPLSWPAGWPVTGDNLRSIGAPFKVSKEKTLADIDDCMRLLGASDWLISSNVATRLDGLPRADGLLKGGASPGMALYFEHKGAVRVLARDFYWDPWSNLRSIGLALDALRTLERHGGRLIMERSLEGFLALPAPASDWRAVLGCAVAGEDMPWVDIALAEANYRALAKQAQGHDAMVRLNLAIEAARAELGGRP